MPLKGKAHNQLRAKPITSLTTARPDPQAQQPDRQLRFYFGGLACGLVAAGLLLWHFGWAKRTLEPPTIDLSQADPALVKAVEDARAGVQKAPRSAPAWGHLGMVFLAHYQLAEAEVCLAQAEQLDPRDGRWPYLRAVVLARSESEATIPELERAAELSPGIAAPRLKLSEVLLGEGRLDEAEKQCLLVLAAEPNNPRAELILGRIAHARGQWKESLEHLQRAAQGAPDVRSTHALLAEVYQRLGDANAAKQEVDRAARSSDAVSWPDPYLEAVAVLKTGVDARLDLARSLFQQGRTQEAFLRMQDILRSRPDSDAAHQTYGLFLLQLGRIAEAEQALREAVRLRPESIQALAQLGLILLTEKKFQEAADSERAALRLNPQYAPAYYNLGLCLRELGDKTGAIDAFRSAVKVRPDLAAAHRDLGQLLAERGEVAEAVRELQDAVRLAPTDETARQLLARLAPHSKG
jgi:tetratricopeptide (TPR) repeat protein